MRSEDFGKDLLSVQTLLAKQVSLHEQTLLKLYDPVVRPESLVSKSGQPGLKTGQSGL